MHADTRQRLLDIAEQLFAERGFYGVSIAAIASEVGFTKQGVLHYFNSKEKLYGAILQRISDDFQKQQTKAEQAFEEPTERLKLFYAALAEPTDTNTRRTRLLMRELLDNNARATSAENWYLKEFLERLIGMVKAIEGLHALSDEEALIFAYQLLGAVNYFLISPATLGGIFGEKYLTRMSGRFSFALDSLIESQVSQLSESGTARIGYIDNSVCMKEQL
jgi:AcrR family transcriptional regulator